MSTSDAPTERTRVDRTVTGVSAGALGTFVLAAVLAPATVGDWVAIGFEKSAAWFGIYWQALLLLTFAVAVVVALTPYARARLGGVDSPEFGRFKWVAMIMCTLLAGGGVFWAAAEPMYHFTSPPPYFGDVPAGADEAVGPALAQSFVHWGFLAWAILGSLGAIVIMYGVQRGMPLRPRTLLYPVLGARVATSKIGTVADIVCIIAVVAGTVGPIGFLGLQVSYGLSTLFGIADGYATQLTVIVVLTAVAVISVLTGIRRGIQLLSRINVWLALALMALVLAVGSVSYVAAAFVEGFGTYAQNFVGMSLYTGDTVWTSAWTVFFFGWFLGYGPLMAIFIARISRGRTVRDLVFSTAVLPPVATCVWFAVLGGTGIMLEQREPGLVSGPLAEFGMPAAVMSIAEHLPLAGVLSIGFLLLTTLFVATTTDSMSYSVAQASMVTGQPSARLRAVWASLMGAAAAVLISVGDGGISALQSFIVITAVPVGFIMLPTLWAAPMYVRRLAREQGLSARQGKPDKSAQTPVGS
ncbi:BCCT family transporter [Amycolatopsis palatopharyngis]|uniref:BCCT family transporter n=1 Tax=Amycolatopsis palatopharyngis TaxID=187982 RepID=UPI000E24A150|nr:BCCT family transporter [Amycolatopsis palatopharyngis]